MDWQTWPRKSIRNKLTFYGEYVYSYVLCTFVYIYHVYLDHVYHVYLVDELPFYLCMNQTKSYQITIDEKYVKYEYSMMK